MRRKLERKNIKVEVQENDHEIIELNENKQSQLEEERTREILVEQRYENEQQQKTYHISLFSEDDEILLKKIKVNSYN